MNDDGLESAFANELLSVCRTGIGDELRSVTYFTEDQVEQVYLRSDLKRTADLIGFAELERGGFRADKLYRNTQLGEYQSTVRMFEYGYLTRVIYDRCGVWVTTDSMSMDRFEELTASLKPVLAEHTGETGLETESEEEQPPAKEEDPEPDPDPEPGEEEDEQEESPDEDQRPEEELPNDGPEEEEE